MNENLRKLMLEAGYAAPEIAPRANALAKLIVQECSRIARNTDLEDVEGGDSAVLRAAGEQIQKYFGVCSKIENIMAGDEIHSGGGYTESTWDGYNEFVKNRNRNEPTL